MMPAQRSKLLRPWLPSATRPRCTDGAGRPSFRTAQRQPAHRSGPWDQRPAPRTSGACPGFAAGRAAMIFLSFILLGGAGECAAAGAYGTGIGPGESRPSRSSRSSLVSARWDVGGSELLSVVNENEGSEGSSTSDVGTGRPNCNASMAASARPSRRSTPLLGPRHMSRRYPQVVRPRHVAGSVLDGDQSTPTTVSHDQLRTPRRRVPRTCPERR